VLATAAQEICLFMLMLVMLSLLMMGWDDVIYRPRVGVSLP
jgi:hypothetical protein